ncbi:MAG: hypothetical protein AB8I08_16315 [Sandaracinaceae bacterium]
MKALIAVADLLPGRRARRLYGEARAADLMRLRARFTAQPSPREAPRSVVEAAARLGALKRALAEAYADVRRCASCAEGCAAPSGAYAGGRCCGTETLTVFTQDEVRLLKLAGRRAPCEAAGYADNAGCAFRGPRGCVLEPEDRPVRCLVYECEELAAELDATGPKRARVLRADLVEAKRALEARFAP